MFDWWCGWGRMGPGRAKIGSDWFSKARCAQLGLYEALPRSATGTGFRQIKNPERQPVGGGPLGNRPGRTQSAARWSSVMGLAPPRR